MSPHLPAGAHTFALAIRDVPGHLHLRIEWRPPGQPPVLVPPRAFAPP